MTEILGPDSFGGTDEGSHYMSQYAAIRRSKVKPKVYIAAPYELREAAIQLLYLLERNGWEVTSSWLRQVDENGDKWARMDLADVARADVLLAVNPESYKHSGTGGRHVELGYAIALGKRIVVLGIRSNIFHYLSDVRIIARIEDL